MARIVFCLRSLAINSAHSAVFLFRCWMMSRCGCAYYLSRTRMQKQQRKWILTRHWHSFAPHRANRTIVHSSTHSHTIISGHNHFMLLTIIYNRNHMHNASAFSICLVVDRECSRTRCLRMISFYCDGWFMCLFPHTLCSPPIRVLSLKRWKRCKCKWIVCFKWKENAVLLLILRLSICSPNVDFFPRRLSCFDKLTFGLLSGAD